MSVERAETAAAGKGEKRKRSRAKLAAFGSATAVAALLALEGALRLSGLPSGVVASLGHCWADAQSQAVGPFRPGHQATIAFPKELTYHASFNSLGLRGADVPLARTPGVPRVLCLGDSTTFGFYVEDQDTYPARLQSRLAASGKKVEVLNCGCGRWTITDEASFLETHALALEPDVVVLLFCGNDLEELDPAPARLQALARAGRPRGEPGRPGRLSLEAIRRRAAGARGADRRLRREAPRGFLPRRLRAQGRAVRQRAPPARARGSARSRA
ncbi:SGNH/GDSL hydrolase family protein [bacterium]|nr:SGNH/GDSL hydrolase family protein [bacterium]